MMRTVREASGSGAGVHNGISCFIIEVTWIISWASFTGFVGGHQEITGRCC